MGRHKKVVDGKVVSARLPKSFLEKMPESYENYGDWLRDLLIGNAEIPANTGSKGLNPEQRHALSFFYELFNHMFEEGKLDDVIEAKPDLLDVVKVFSQVVHDA